MSLLGPQYAHREAGTLHLSVQYLGDEPDRSGESRSRFSWRVESVDPDLRGSFTNHHLYAPLGALVTADDALRVAASKLVDAAKQFQAGMPPDGRYPLWLQAMAHRNLAELSAVAAAASDDPLGQHVEELRLPTPSDLLAVEVARALLRGGPNIINAELLDGEDLAELREVTARANREVVVPDPEDPFAPPLYEGPAADAYTRLEPGMYPAHGLNGDELAVIVDHSPLSRAGMASAAFPTAVPAAEPTSGADRADHSIARTETRSSAARNGHGVQGPQRPPSAPSFLSRGTDRQMPPSLGL